MFRCFHVRKLMAFLMLFHLGICYYFLTNLPTTRISQECVEWISDFFGALSGVVNSLMISVALQLQVSQEQSHNGGWSNSLL